MFVLFLSERRNTICGSSNSMNGSQFEFICFKMLVKDVINQKHVTVGHIRVFYQAKWQFTSFWCCTLRIYHRLWNKHSTC